MSSKSGVGYSMRAVISQKFVHGPTMHGISGRQMGFSILLRGIQPAEALEWLELSRFNGGKVSAQMPADYERVIGSRDLCFRYSGRADYRVAKTQLPTDLHLAIRDLFQDEAFMNVEYSFVETELRICLYTRCDILSMRGVIYKVMRRLNTYVRQSHQPAE